MKKKLLKSACLLVAAGTLSMAQSVLAESNWNISGWLNEGLTYYDDGESSDLVQVSDNGTTLGSRITLSGSTDLSNSGLTAGFEVILQPQSNQVPLGAARQDRFDRSTASSHSIGVLGNNVYVSGVFGKLTVGLQSMPTDNVAVLADPSLTLWSGISPVFRGNGFILRGMTGTAFDETRDAFRSADTDDDTNIVVWGDFLECLVGSELRGNLGIGLDCNGIYRQGVRYDLPAFGPVHVAVGYANDDIYDIAVKYNEQIGRLNVMAHFGYAMNQGPTTTTSADDVANGVANQYESAENFQIQIGVMDQITGLFGSFSYQQEEADGAIATYGDDTDSFYFKGGVKRAFTSIGDTAIYGEYGQYNDQYGDLGRLGVTGSEVERMGFSVDQYFGDRFILYGKYESLSLDVDGTADFNNVDDLDTFTLGAVLFF